MAHPADSGGWGDVASREGSVLGVGRFGGVGVGVGVGVGIFGFGISEAGLEGVGEGDPFLDVHGLGADLAGEAEGVEQGVDVGLGPAVFPDAVEDAAEVLAAVDEDAADEELEPGQVGDLRALLGVGDDLDDGRGDLGTGPEDLGGEGADDLDVGKGLEEDGEGAESLEPGSARMRSASSSWTVTTMRTGQRSGWTRRFVTIGVATL